MKTRHILWAALALTLLVTGMGLAQYNEAPMLAERVASGELPPVDERLPVEPLVVVPYDDIGQYGGVWRRAALSTGDVQLSARLSYETLVRWNLEGSDVMPNVAESFDVCEENRTFTFYLREGMKWSDGHPFTAADFEFWWESGIMNEDLHPVPPAWLLREGELPEFRVLDDYTIQFEYAVPYGVFLRQMAYHGEGVTQFPKHYLSQYHPDYVDADTLQAMAEETQREAWYQLFWDRRDARRNLDMPVIWAWMPTVPAPATTQIAERNPYYWKVDPEGNQLPYIDTMIHDVVENAEVLNLRAATGEIDMQLRHIMWENLPIFVDNAERHNFRILQWASAEASNYMYYPNMFHEDPVKRDLFRNPDFRRALSMAIDREEIQMLAYVGLGRTRQGGVIQMSPFYVEGSDQWYAERDLDAANELLDALGMDQRDSGGYRLGPDGERFTINIVLSPVFGPWPRVTEMVIDYWSDVGIRAVADVVERSLHGQRSGAGDFDYSVWTNDRGLTPDVDPLFLLPGRGQAVQSPWFDWFISMGERGEAPPDGPFREAYDLYAAVLNAEDNEELTELMKELVELNNSQLFYTGVVGDLPHVVIVAGDMYNVPEVAPSDWLQKTPGNTWPEQYSRRP